MNTVMEKTRRKRRRNSMSGRSTKPVPWRVVVLTILQALCLGASLVVSDGESSSNNKDSSSPNAQWSQWVKENLQRIQSHQNNIQQALVFIKNLLQEMNEEVSKNERDLLLSKLWEQQGRRIAFADASFVEESALEVRETGAVCKSQPDFLPESISPAVESQLEPFVGMVMHVSHVSDSSLPDYSSPVESYELVEPVHLELGTVPKHHSDYAYKPVSSLGKSGQSANVADSSLTVKESTKVSPVIESAWWRWWFTIMGLGQRNKARKESSYRPMGERAFAGGSHGEIWRGRQRCELRQKNPDFHCDETKPLILKRLKIEHGLHILEAGLREVYAGNLLAREPGTENFFTVYVDHFFREVPRPTAFVGRSASKQLELWIVFEEAGPSLRSYLYRPLLAGDFVIHQHSPFWTSLRMSTSNFTDNNSEHSSVSHSHGSRQSRTAVVGKALMREVLRQILTSVAYLHSHGMVHRDIKPSNVLCKSNVNVDSNALDMDLSQVHCVLGDFSSVWDSFTDQNLYSNGPSAAEQTPEYAPPEALVSTSWIPFHPKRPESYDLWSIGVLALELLLGTPNVFSVDQRTTALLSNKMKKEGATQEEIQRALYLAALSQFCIYMPASASNKSWPLRDGDPLHNASMVKQTCTLRDFHRALRARDPLGIGFDSSADMLLHLVWRLLALDPLDRISAADALHHPYFTVIDLKEHVEADDNPKALESLMLDPRMDMPTDETPKEFVCPKCGRIFADWHSCQAHATMRKHAKFCDYDRSMLPSCLNAHSMLPAHPTSGYCDIQGRRSTIEDFHSIHLHPSHQFYGVFDGHTGNLASKYAASMLYYEIAKRLSNLDTTTMSEPNWKQEVQKNVTDAFETIHHEFLHAVTFVPAGAMDQSGTTATVVYVVNDAILVASVGDSRAVMSSISEDGSRIVALPLTVDHVASNPHEQRRVEEKGGVIGNSGGGLARVNGTLAITRSIGDASLSSILSREPHIATMTRDEFKDQCGFSSSSNIPLLPCFVVLATDGLWDVMSNQEAVHMVVQVVATYDSKHGTSWEDGGAFQQAAELLTQEAFVRGSTDNIGVCVIAIQ